MFSLQGECSSYKELPYLCTDGTKQKFRITGGSHVVVEHTPQRVSGDDIRLSMYSEDPAISDECRRKTILQAEDHVQYFTSTSYPNAQTG
ncbi:hypothetical protein ScPMuIL_016400 [Solemya velum]